ncbi:MAG: MMPL family transporter [Syntrophobacterales bacterium]|jgi:predicted exporter|nr:MMPL family transporter [Syntrophobacterales bacterium]
MSLFYTIFSRAFEFFSRRKIILYAMIVAVMGLSAVAMRGIRLSEDIKPMLPEGSSDAAIDFRLLQQTPFLQKVVINLKAGPEIDRDGLVEAADRLAKALGEPFYDRVVAGPDLEDPEELFTWFLKASPSLMTESDMTRIGEFLNQETVSLKLQDVRAKLQSSEGWIMKPLLRGDPLGFYMIVLEKIKFMNMFKGMTLKENHFISADGKNTLLIGKTSIKFTDAVGSKDLITYTKRIINANTPSGIAVSFLSGHAYTTANAETIKEDLYVILSCASVTILCLLFLFMRNWRAVFVFLVPTSVVYIATAGILSIYGSISAVTIAFGSVLMGIADDYPIFTYLSLRDMGAYGGTDVARISRPVLFSGITTMATFSALFFSELPGQRQIAMFSIIGITASLIFSLIILPHFIRGLPPTGEYAVRHVPIKGAAYRTAVVTVWVLLIAACLICASRLKFNGDMRAITMVPAAITAMEEELKQTWGDFRGMAMVFTEGMGMESALENNDRLFSYLKRRVPRDEFLSIAPLLPSAHTQEANRLRWETKWSNQNRNIVKRLLDMEGDKEGFSSTAFDLFLKRLEERPLAVTEDGLRKAGLGEAVDSMIIRDGSVVRILTFVPDTPEVSALFKDRADTPFVARFVSNRQFNNTISTAMVKNFIQYIIMASFVIMVFLAALFRNLKKVLLAAVPVATGLIFMFGVMGWRGIEFNLFNIIATILVIGLSVDLGIFMVSRISEGNSRNTNMAVFLGGLTSLVGMGALALARHPAIHSIGVSVLLGMCGAIPTALFVIPALGGSRGPREARGSLQ